MTQPPTLRYLDRTTPPHISTLILMVGISALNMSIFLPALNVMADEFAVPYSTMLIAVSGYLAVTGVLQIFVGPLADKYGRRPVMLVGLAVFVVATLGAMVAPTAGVFLAFRMIQGGVATAMVLTRAIVRDMVPANQAASMIGYVTMGMSLVPMIGPTLGGIIAENFGWRAIFGFLAVCGAGVFALSYYDQGETVRGGGMSFREQVRTYPELLTSPRFWGYSLSAAFASGAFFAYLGGASFVAERVFGLSPVWTGVALGAPAIGYALGNFVSGRYSVWLGVNRMILLGSAVVAVGLAIPLAFGLVGIMSAGLFFGFCTLMGMGNGMVLPNATAGALSVRAHLAGTASGLAGAIMIGGGAALSVLAGVFLDGGSSALPLQWLMWGSSVASVLAILYVIQREKTRVPA